MKHLSAGELNYERHENHESLGYDWSDQSDLTDWLDLF